MIEKLLRDHAKEIQSNIELLRLAQRHANGVPMSPGALYQFVKWCQSQPAETQRDLGLNEPENQERIKWVLEQYESIQEYPMSADLLLLGMVRQDVYRRSDGAYDACCLRAHADALRHLCKIGIMRPEEGYEDNVNGPDRDFIAVIVK